MKSKYPVILLFAVSISACDSGNQSEKKIEFQSRDRTTPNEEEIAFNKGVVIKNVINKFDSSQSYCIYIPENLDPEKGSAVLFFDPKGEGSIPVKKYQSVAEQYGLILAGSNNSKNGLNPELSEAITRNFVKDISTRLKVSHQKIIASGFSGGAKVAVQTAVREKLSGVVGCGAGFPFEPDRNYGFSYIGIVGNEDFNYLEMKRQNGKLDLIGINHQLIVFDGEHEWPTVERMEIAILCLTDIIGNKKISDDNKVTELLAKNSAHLSVSLDENEIDRREVVLQTELAQAFSKQDFKLLRDKINSLSSGHKEESREQKLSNKRVLNFISLMGFLYSEKALNINLAVADQYLDIYEKADYDNPDYHYLRACYNAKSGLKNEAIAEIKKSVNYGFTDFNKAIYDGLLSSLQDESIFTRLIDSLRSVQ